MTAGYGALRLDPEGATTSTATESPKRPYRAVGAVVIALLAASGCAAVLQRASPSSSLSSLAARGAVGHTASASVAVTPSKKHDDDDDGDDDDDDDAATLALQAVVETDASARMKLYAKVTVTLVAPPAADGPYVTAVKYAPKSGGNQLAPLCESCAVFPRLPSGWHPDLNGQPV